MRRALDRLYAAGGVLAALCVLAIFVLMIGASIGRGLNWRVGWVNDVVSWLCAAAAFFGMASGALIAAVPHGCTHGIRLASSSAMILSVISV